MAKQVQRSPKASIGTADTRRKVFVERYLVNGNNAADAAIFAGYSERTARSAGCRLMADPAVKAMVGNRAEKVLHDAQLTTERWAKEMAAIGHLDPGEFYDAEGFLIPLHKLPEHVRRAIASVDAETDATGKTTTKIKTHDKNVALANIGKHLGAFERDNHQKINAIQVVVELVG